MHFARMEKKEGGKQVRRLKQGRSDVDALGIDAAIDRHVDFLCALRIGCNWRA